MTTDKKIYVLLFIYAFVLIFFCSLSSPLYDFNSWADLNIYFTMGKSIFNGLVPYKDVFDHKGPLIFFIYGVGYLISNDTFTGVYIITSLFLFIGLLYNYLIARLFVGWLPSLIVSLCFSVFSLIFNRSSGSPEEYILMLFSVSMYYFMKCYKDSFENIPPKTMFLQGILATSVFCIKLNLSIFFIVPLLVILLNLLFKKEYQKLVKSLVYLTFGASVIMVPLLLYFTINNAFSDLWFAYIDFNLLYSSLENNFGYFYDLFLELKTLIKRNPILGILSLSGILAFSISSSLIKSKLARITFFISSVLTLCMLLPKSRFLEYYYHPLIIYTSLGCIYIITLIRSKIKYRIHSKKVICYLTVASILIISCYTNNFLNDTSSLFNKEFKPSMVNTFSDKIKEDKEPTLIVLGLNRGIGVFTKANIVPNVKYFFNPNIPYEKFPEIMDSQKDYIEDKKVEFIILSSDYYQFNSVRSWDELNKNYAAVDSMYEDRVEYFLYKAK